MSRRKSTVWLALTRIAALAAIAGAFMLYTRPEFMVQISNQVWACF
jgi:hypothetical protein